MSPLPEQLMEFISPFRGSRNLLLRLIPRPDAILTGFPVWTEETLLPPLVTFFFSLPRPPIPSPLLAATGAPTVSRFFIPLGLLERCLSYFLLP